MKKLFGVAIAAVGLYLGFGVLLYVTQRDHMYFPSSLRPDSVAAGVESLREVELTTQDGLRLLAWYAPPSDNNPVLLYFHGNAGSLQNRVERFERFAREGLGILMVQYRGYGGNPGTPSETGLFADANAAMAFLGQEKVSGDRIAVYGESLGTGVASYIAAQYQTAAVILENPFTSFAAIAALQYPYLPVGLMLKDKFDSLSRIGDVREPLLVLQGALDTIVPPSQGQVLFATANQPKELWSAPTGGHSNLMEFGASEVVIDFLRRHVPSFR